MEKENNSYSLWILFKENFLISALTVGGGYVIVPLMQKKFVDELGWIEEEEMIDMLAMAQASPGVFTINASIIIGYRLRGIIGSLVAVVAAILPPLISVAIISVFYVQFKDQEIVRNGLKGAQAVVGAIMINVVINYCGKVFKTKNWLPIAIMIVAFALDFFVGISTILIILLCTTIGTLLHMFLRSREMGGPKE